MRISAAVSRRAALSAALSTFAVVTPVLPALGISATTMTGKTKPDLGVVLLDEAKSTGNTLSADLVLDGGVVATAAFNSKWPLAEGGYYDFEAATRDGETAFMQVKALGSGESLSSVPKKWFSDALFSVDGRYGAYGAPSDLKLKEVEGVGGTRSFDMSFTVLSPGGSDVPRKGVMKAIQAPGSQDVLFLTASSGANKWKSSESEARSIVESFRIARTQPTALKREASADYRFGKTSGPSTMKSRNDGF